jgi:hypothetical protein
MIYNQGIAREFVVTPAIAESGYAIADPEVGVWTTH